MITLTFAFWLGYFFGLLAHEQRKTVLSAPEHELVMAGRHDN